MKYESISLAFASNDTCYYTIVADELTLQIWAPYKVTGPNTVFINWEDKQLEIIKIAERNLYFTDEIVTVDHLQWGTLILMYDPTIEIH